MALHPGGGRVGRARRDWQRAEADPRLFGEASVVLGNGEPRGPRPLRHEDLGGWLATGEGRTQARVGTEGQK